jgi:hypothetical protein
MIAIKNRVLLTIKKLILIPAAALFVGVTAGGF